MLCTRGGTLGTAFAQFDDLFGRNHNLMDEAVVLGVAHHFLDGGLYALFKAGVGVHDVPAGFPGILVPRAQLGLNCGRRQNVLRSQF